MTPAERWQLVSDLFNDALELPSEERQGFVERSGKGEEVVREVLDLVANEENDSGPLARPYFSLHERRREDDPNIGRQVGPYRLVRRLGQGGMGVQVLCQALGAYAWHGRHHVAHITSLRRRNPR